MKEELIKERLDEIRYEIEDFFDNGERRKDVYKYDDHKILAEIVEKKLGILFEDIRNENCNCHTKYVDVFNPDGIKIGSRINYSPNIKKC
jgi:hypothetical protein